MWFNFSAIPQTVKWQSSAHNSLSLTVAPGTIAVNTSSKMVPRWNLGILCSWGLLSQTLRPLLLLQVLRHSISVTSSLMCWMVPFSSTERYFFHWEALTCASAILQQQVLFPFQIVSLASQHPTQHILVSLTIASCLWLEHVRELQQALFSHVQSLTA